MSRLDQIGSHKTTVSTIGRATVVVYHQTPVVTFDSRCIILNTGGWKTATTKTRMNQAARQYGLGYSVYQSKGDWYVDYGGQVYEFSGNTLEINRNSLIPV